jgi:hypothetical protein
MDYLQVTNSDVTEVMRQLQSITNSGKSIGSLLDYLQKHNELLDDDEYVNIEAKVNKPSPGPIGFILMNKKYSINIKKSTIIILAFLLDLNLSKGIASLVLNLSGFSFQVLQKIENEEKCLVIDILLGNKKNASDFNYNNEECVQNEIKCPYRDEYFCKRPIETINNLFEKLIAKQVIQKKLNYSSKHFEYPKKDSLFR